MEKIKKIISNAILMVKWLFSELFVGNIKEPPEYLNPLGGSDSDAFWKRPND